MPYTYQYPRPAVTVDIILLDTNNTANLLLIQRKKPPFQGKWAFPGGFIDAEETLEHAAVRELKEETGLTIKHLKQFKTFSEPKRDPRGRTISTVFYGYLPPKTADQTKAGDDAARAKWFPLENLPALAFDHDQIMIEFKKFMNL